MNKPPAFQFYAGDFLHGSAEMTLEETGLYIRLLCHQWLSGSLPADPGRASRLACTTVEVFERLWPVVGPKFEPGPDGRLRNARLEAEREKQRKWREQQVASGRRGGQATQRAKRGASSEPSSEPTSENQALHSSLFSPRSSSSPSVAPAGEKNKGRSAFVLPPWVPSELWEAFMEVRAKKRAPATDKALQLLVNGLDKLQEAGFSPVEVLEQSIVNGWKGLFPLKGDANANGTNRAAQRTANNIAAAKEAIRLRAERAERAARDAG